VLEGMERHSHAELRLFYVGGSKVNKNYIANLVFGRSGRERYLGRFWMLRPTRFKHERVGEFDIVITEIPNGPVKGSHNSSFFVPCWVDGRTKIDQVFQLTKTSEKIKSDLRRIHRLQYSYEVVHEKGQFVYFYNRMYVPHIKAKYGNEATLHSLDGILGKIDYSELLLIKDGPTSVAGEVIVYQNGGPKILCMGVLDGDRRYVRKGAICALYYFRSVYLKGKGHIEIDLGASRGFLSDGVLSYKRKWGLMLTAIRGGGFLIHPQNLNKGVRTFLINNPFIISEPDGFKSVCFLEDNRPLTPKEQKRLVSKLNVPGIKKLLVCQLNGDCTNFAFCENPPLPAEMRRIKLTT
jgi:hypothetical protein